MARARDGVERYIIDSNSESLCMTPFLRQAVERLVALDRETFMLKQGVVDKKQTNKLKGVYDCIVEMGEELPRG